MKSASGITPRTNRTICLKICQENYEDSILNSILFRREIDQNINKYPELYPPAIAYGYKMKEIRKSKKLCIYIRRIEVSGISYTIRPSFVMPYMTGLVKDVEKPLFLRKFSVPFWGLSHCFGKNPMYWYRLESHFGRNSLLGTTIKSAENLPKHLIADEKHSKMKEGKAYIATTSGNGCILGACVASDAGTLSLEKAYSIFKQEAEQIDPNYKPLTVNTDGWKSTQNAWKILFPTITLLSCFLHIFIGIRKCASKKLKDIFSDVSTKLWNCYNAKDKRTFSQRVRRLAEWSIKKKISSKIREKIEKLRDNLPQYAQTYDFKGSHRTSNMIDRLMKSMDRHLFTTQYFHSNEETSNQSIRSWALILNFAPFNPQTILEKNGIRCPFEQANGFNYHENWLENLLIAASLRGYRERPPNPL